MTNRDLVTKVQNGVRVLANGVAPHEEIDFLGATTTQVRYAVKENRDRMQDCLDTYEEMLQEAAEEHDVDVEDTPAVVNELVYRPEDNPSEVAKELDVPTEGVEEIKDLLSMEIPFEPYTVPESAIFEEQGVPLQVLELIDWMVEKE